MEIKVTFDHGKLLFDPDPAYVYRGESVSWAFRTNAIAMPLRWIVYLHHGSPFRRPATDFTTDTTPSQGRHSGRTSGMPAQDPGDYTYGVRLDDLIRKVTLADDDPRLIVPRD
jgi:hypothetical protein